MKQNKTDRLLLGVSIGSFAILSGSFLLMPVEGMGPVAGLLFWGGLILGTVLQFVLEACRKALFARYNVKPATMQKARSGLLSFRSNTPASVADIIMVGAVVATVAAFLLTKATGYICYVCLSVLIFSFCMHCILNGRIYVYVKNRDKVQQMLEQKKANSKVKGEGKK